MRVIITFGQDHTHRVNNYTFDKDSVAIIEAESRTQGREIAVELFGLKFCTSYTEDYFDEKGMLSYYPRGKHPANF